MNKEKLPPVDKGNLSFYRWHSRQFFHPEPELFFLNFVETPRTMRAQNRYAGAETNSGFYFGATDEIVLAEKIFYAGYRAVDRSEGQKLRRNFLQQATLLRVVIDCPEMLDLTSPYNIRRALELCYKVNVNLDRVHVLEFLHKVMPESAGGDFGTDYFGHCACEAGYRGIIFPSIRALMFPNVLTTTWGWWLDVRFGRIPKVHASEETGGTTEAFVDQVSHDYNVVMFSGTKLVSSIKSYSWLDLDESEHSSENPFYNAPAEAIEAARLRQKAERGLSREEAIEQGLESDEIMLSELDFGRMFFNCTIEPGRWGQ